MPQFDEKDRAKDSAEQSTHFEVDSPELAGQQPGTSGAVSKRDPPSSPKTDNEDETAKKGQEIKNSITSSLSEAIKSDWFKNKHLLIQKFLQTALKILLKLNPVLFVNRDGRVNDILSVVACLPNVLRLVLEVHATYTAYTSVVSVPFKDDMDMVSQRLLDLKKQKEKIQSQFYKLEESLEKVANISEPNLFASKEWKSYKVKKIIIVGQFKEYLAILENSEKALKKLQSSFKENKDEFKQACKAQKHHCLRLFVGTSIFALFAVGLGSKLAKLSVFKSVMGGSALVLGIGGWEYWRYRITTDITQPLHRLELDLTTFKEYKTICEDRLWTGNEHDEMELVGIFMDSARA